MPRTANTPSSTNRAADLTQHVQRVRMSTRAVVAGPGGVRYDWA